jgi:hypothetical protein
MPQVISLANFHYIEKYFGEKKFGISLCKCQKSFPRKKKPENPGKEKKKKKLIGNASVFFPQQFCLFWTKLCGINIFP